jgi:hypothetical protein
VKRSLCCAAVLAIAAFPRPAAAGEADPARIVVDPDAYLGRPVTVAVKFLKIEQGREHWEEQANLNEATMIKFRVTHLGEIRCYAPRTQRNTAALTGLARGTRVVLAGVVKRFRTKVVTKYEVTGKGHRRKREVVRTVRGQVRYSFIVDSIARAE